MKIIPAIDIFDGKCVRLTQGDYSKKKEYGDPLEMAIEFEKAGISCLHMVDLDGARTNDVVNLNTLKEVSNKTNLTIDFGGGVKSNDSLTKVFNAGADQVTAGSVAVKNPNLVEEWIAMFGPEKIILGADVNGEKIAIQGWKETSNVDLFDFLEGYIKKGIQYTICTDISKDGLLQGPSFDLYTRVLKRFPSLKLIASGGVSSLDDLLRLKEMGVFGAIVGKAYYEGKISLEELAVIND